MTTQSICVETGSAGAATAPATAPSSAPLHGSWIGTLAEFAELAAEWNNLFERAQPESIFLSYGWMFTWWKHFAKGRLAVIAVRDAAGRLTAVAPFYIARSIHGLGTRRLSFLADDHVGSDYLSVLVEQARAAEAVAEIARIVFEHRREWDYIELRDTADSPVMAALAAELRTHGMRAVEISRRGCRYIPLAPTFEKYLAGISSGLRANYRRRWRALQQEHETECLGFADAAGVERHFPELIALHRMRFAQRDDASAFVARGLPEFHSEAMRYLAAQGYARLYLLRSRGLALAALYGFSVGRTFQFYQCGMRPDWVRYGLGQVLIGNAIEKAITARHVTFDFLRGDEPYKAQWAECSRENITLRFFDGRPASVAARLSLRLSGKAMAAGRGLRARLLARVSQKD